MGSIAGFGLPKHDLSSGVNKGVSLRTIMNYYEYYPNKNWQLKSCGNNLGIFSDKIFQSSFVFEKHIFCGRVSRKMYKGPIKERVEVDLNSKVVRCIAYRFHRTPLRKFRGMKTEGSLSFELYPGIAGRYNSE